MSHNITNTSQHLWLFPLATLSPLSTITTILLSAQQGTPQTDQQHFVLNCVHSCNQCRPMSHIPHTTQMALLLTTPLPPSSLVPNKAPPNHNELNVLPVLVTNVAHQLDPMSLVKLDCHSPDLVSNFSPTAPVTNIAHQLDPTSLVKLDHHSLDLVSDFSPTTPVTNVAHQLNPTSLTGLDVQLFANCPCY